jgi:hypothetical protein
MYCLVERPHFSSDPTTGLVPAQQKKITDADPVPSSFVLALTFFLQQGKLF